VQKPWLGSRKVAFVPVITGFDTPPPDDDLVQRVQRRVFFDADTTKGADVSLRAFLWAVSYGNARLDATVFRPVHGGSNPGSILAAVKAAVPAGVFDYVGAITLDDRAGGITQDIYFHSDLASGVGAWARELVAVATGYDDFGNSDGLATFDNNASAAGSHSCAYAKLALHWLDPGARAMVTGVSGTFDLHALAFLAPPPPGRYAAVRVQAETKAVMVEARLRVDAFDARIASEGVIVYEIQQEGFRPDGVPSASLVLRTPTALGAGQSYDDPELSVRVTAAIPGGFRIDVKKKVSSECAGLHRQLDAAQAELDTLTSDSEPGVPKNPRIRVLVRRIQALQQRIHALGC